MTDPSPASPYRLGTRRGLEACASPRGTYALLALDHRQNLRKELHPESPEATTYDEMVAFKRAVIRALAQHATGSLLDPEIGAGVDVALEASGSPAALAQVVDVTRPRGTVVLGGNQPPDGSLPMTFVEALMRRELTLTGCFMSYSAPWPGHEWTDSLAAVLDGGLDMPAMISHRTPLSAAPALFAEVAAHRLAHRKIVFDPTA